MKQWEQSNNSNRGLTVTFIYLWSASTLPWHETIISHLTGKKLQGNTLTSSPSSSSTDSESLSDVTVSCLLLPGITSSNSETGQQKQKHIRCTQASVTSFINVTENHSAMCLLQYQLLNDYLFG
jgi:hypothetical protein